MQCPVCGERLKVVKTNASASDIVIVRTRSCINPLCPFVAKTYESLDVGKSELTRLVELYRQVCGEN